MRKKMKNEQQKCLNNAEKKAKKEKKNCEK